MFEQEIELEKRQSTALPLLLILGLIVILVATAIYFVMESRKVLAKPEAEAAVSKILEAQSTSVSFHVGAIQERFDESATDARYKFLEKIGILKVSKGAKPRASLTAKGNELLQQIAGVQHSAEKDGSEGYVVPLATRRLVEISNITMAGPERATIQYSWRWQTNALGESFDASSGNLDGLNSWDRVALIDKHGVRFYHEAPAAETLVLAKTSRGWQPVSE